MAASSKTLEQLLASMQNQTYTPLTNEEIQKQASGRYTSAYDQKRLSANQAFDTSDQALAQQLSSLQASYDKQREESKEGFAQTYAQADRQALSRGMQRSSYNNATLANINVKGQKALQGINDAQAAQEQNINQQRTLAAQQLADQLASYDAQQKADEMAYADELESREYERQVQNQALYNDLAMAIYNAQFGQEQFEYQKEQDAIAQSNWEKQFKAQYGGGSSGGSGGGSGGGGGGDKPTGTNLYDLLGSGINKSIISSGVNSALTGVSAAAAAKKKTTK